MKNREREKNYRIRWSVDDRSGNWVIAHYWLKLDLAASRKKILQAVVEYYGGEQDNSTTGALRSIENLRRRIWELQERYSINGKVAEFIPSRSKKSFHFPKDRLEACFNIRIQWRKEGGWGTAIAILDWLGSCKSDRNTAILQAVRDIFDAEAYENFPGATLADIEQAARAQVFRLEKRIEFLNDLIDGGKRRETEFTAPDSFEANSPNLSPKLRPIELIEPKENFQMVDFRD
jgi:hypothetical protein